MKKYNKTIHYLTRSLEYDKDNLFDDIKYVYKGKDREIFRNAVLITPGEWADSVTNAPVVWEESKLMAYSNNWYSNYINLGHQHNPLSFVGFIENQKWFNGAIRGDLCIYTNISKGKDAVTGIKNGLLNNLSIEVATHDYWNTELMKRCADEITFLGVSLLGPFPPPACADAKIN